MHIDYKPIVNYRNYSSLRNIRSDGIFAKNLAMKTEKQLRNSIGSVLLSKRQSLAADGIKITQEDIAFEAGISTRYYGKIERGEAMPTLYTLMVLAPTLQLSLAELIKQIEEF